MNKEELLTAESAKNFIKEHRRELLQNFASLEKFPPSESPPTTYFMAGSPGAGKTEFSKQILDLLPEEHIVRIDADEIKTFIPQYNKENSDVIQGAASLGVEKLYDHVLRNKQNALIDGTLANYEKAKKNIERSLRKKRHIHIFYLFQDPFIAWDFTQKREKLEGRYIPKEAFVKSLFLARENIKKLKDEFQKEISLHLVIKSSTNSIQTIQFNIAESAIDSFVKIPYNKDILRKRLC
jgi:predicted ABC-type ATPase